MSVASSRLLCVAGLGQESLGEAVSAAPVACEAQVEAVETGEFQGYCVLDVPPPDNRK